MSVSGELDVWKTRSGISSLYGGLLLFLVRHLENNAQQAGNSTKHVFSSSILTRCVFQTDALQK